MVRKLAVILVISVGLAAQGLPPTLASPVVAAHPTIARARPPFEGSVHWIDDATVRLMRGNSWHRGCPVLIRDLRLIRVTYWGFDRTAHMGEVVVHEDYATDFVRLFRRLYATRYPIRRLRLVDHYGGSDIRSMKADNTSAFNCRWAAGNPGVWSMHAYGQAIDVNPVENPSVRGRHVSPPAGRRFANRANHRRGMIRLHDSVWWAFRSIGWEWGGQWRTLKDYQHFSSNGR